MFHISFFLSFLVFLFSFYISEGAQGTLLVTGCSHLHQTWEPAASMPRGLHHPLSKSTRGVVPSPAPSPPGGVSCHLPPSPGTLLSPCLLPEATARPTPPFFFSLFIFVLQTSKVTHYHHKVWRYVSVSNL